MTTGENEDFLAWVSRECGDEVKAEFQELMTDIKAPELPEPAREEIAPEQEEKKAQDIRQLIDKMTIPQKMKAAMFGNSVCRKILIFDPNRLIQECVLGNPKLQQPEIEQFAMSTSIDSQLLRSIAAKSAWMKSYKLKQIIVTNPKCPPDLSLKWFRFLNMSDVKNLSRSKNIPQVLQVAAKKKLSEGER